VSPPEVNREEEGRNHAPKKKGIGETMKKDTWKGKKASAKREGKGLNSQFSRAGHCF